MEATKRFKYGKEPGEKKEIWTLPANAATTEAIGGLKGSFKAILAKENRERPSTLGFYEAFLYLQSVIDSGNLKE